MRKMKVQVVETFDVPNMRLLVYYDFMHALQVHTFIFEI
jgi:hypothetical protein